MSEFGYGMADFHAVAAGAAVLVPADDGATHGCVLASFAGVLRHIGYPGALPNLA